ncbi:hypothetical protein ACHAWO_006968 [Cyclotella atomus]|uniref:DAGKc domain-containing protein n=1 Tax=Cyclotella atomus TaxID=382360 RepID=A0ABD3QYC6_9STRA
MRWGWVHFNVVSAVLLLLLASNPCTALSSAAKESIPSVASSGESTAIETSIGKQQHQPIHIKSTAAILNVNARAVNPPLISLTRQILGDENVHVTSTADEARAAARHVIGDKYSLVIPMGGDGTLSAWIDNLVEEVMLQDGVGEVEEAVGRLPVIGYVPRGTGNGLGHVIGCYEEAVTAKQTTGENVGSIENKGFLSRINPLSRRKQNRRERTKQLLLRLKEVGDLLQQQREIQSSGGVTNQGETTSSSQLIQSKAEEIQQHLSNKCTIVEMPMMQVIHREDHATTSVSSNSTTQTDKGDLCFFAGSGFDSLMLHDFQQIKAWSSTSKSLPTFLKAALSSVAGYCVALVTLTLPQTLRYGTHKICVKVTTRDEGALWIDHRRGDFAELAVKSGACNALGVANGQAYDAHNGITNTEKKKVKHLLYSGTTGILAASTTPYYGGGLRLFPYARLIPNKLQLRLGRISPLVGFVNIPKIFEGSYREKSDKFGCLDFVGEEFDVEVSSPVYEEYLRRRRRRRGGKTRWWKRIRGKAAPNDDEKEKEVTTNGETNGSDATTTSGFPFQHSGESMGIKERFRLRVVKRPIRFVSFLRPRVIEDK